MFDHGPEYQKLISEIKNYSYSSEDSKKNVLEAIRFLEPKVVEDLQSGIGSNIASHWKSNDKPKVTTNEEELDDEFKIGKQESP